MQLGVDVVLRVVVERRHGASRAPPGLERRPHRQAGPRRRDALRPTRRPAVPAHVGQHPYQRLDRLQVWHRRTWFIGRRPVMHGSPTIHPIISCVGLQGRAAPSASSSELLKYCGCSDRKKVAVGTAASSWTLSVNAKPPSARWLLAAAESRSTFQNTPAFAPRRTGSRSGKRSAT